MIINCGIPRAERRAMAWETERARLSQWHPFFALLPRRIGQDRCVWLEWIQRKGRYIDSGYYGGTWSFEYRLTRVREAGL